MLFVFKIGDTANFILFLLKDDDSADICVFFFWSRDVCVSFGQTLSLLTKLTNIVFIVRRKYISTDKRMNFFRVGSFFMGGKID